MTKMELAQCIICRDSLKLDDIVAGICGHTFHCLCINQWQKNTNNCPQCRTPFIGKPLVKLYFDIPDAEDREEFSKDPAFLNVKIKDLNAKVQEKETKIKEEQSKLKAAKKELKGTRSELLAVREALEKSDSINNALKRQLQFLDKHKEEADKARHNSEILQRNLDNLQTVNELVKGERTDVELMLRKFRNSPDALQQVITSFVIMKKEFEKLKESKLKMNEAKKSMRKEMDEMRRTMQASFNETVSLKEQLKIAETDMEHVERERKNLLKKISSLEQAFASPSPRASAIKRLLKESPAPMSAKKARASSPDQSENIPKRVAIIEEDNEMVEDFVNNVDFQEEFSDSFNELASEIGLKVVNTTTITHKGNSNKLPLSKMNINIRPTMNWQASSSSSSVCPVVQKGYNGLGGQSRFVKPSTKKRLSSKVKVPKTAALKNAKPISSHFLPKRNPPLPNFNLSPS